MRGEFHIHTTHSDGVCTVKQILEHLKGKIDYIAITDHDTLDGSIEAYDICNIYNIKSIVGVEISTIRNNESVHILGYFNGYSNLDGLKETLKEITNHRINRLYKIKQLLKQHFNIDLDCEKLTKLSSVSRGSIARQIIAQGYNYTMEELFKYVIGETSKAYVPSSKLETKDAIDLIHKYNGLAVVAHPKQYKKNNILDLIKYNIDGIEAIYQANTSEEDEYYTSLARMNNLLITCGNDFHAFNDYKHGDLLYKGLYGEDLKKFIQKVESL